VSAPHTVEFRSVNTTGGITSISAQKTGSGVWFHTKRYAGNDEGGHAPYQTSAEIAVLLDDNAAAELGEFVVTHSGIAAREEHTDTILALLKRMSPTDIVEACNVGEITTAVAYSALMEHLHDSSVAKTWLMAYRLGKRDGGVE
jgi:hypothetical protein